MRLISNSALRDTIDKAALRQSDRTVRNMAGAVADVMWGFRSVDEAMFHYFDEPVWPDTGVSTYSLSTIHSLLIDVAARRMAAQ